ncbi:MAG: hypothetical protein H6817_06420 [Phycisphaerales bacterium]|nr:hypothetical protein [Phycisphaerales bacterium]
MALTAGVVLLSVTVSQAQERMSLDGVWRSVDRASVLGSDDVAWVRPEKYTAFTVDDALLDSVLAQAPMEGSVDARAAQPEIILPMPDGTYARFRFVESPIMAPELAAKYPDIHTYLGQGVDDPNAVVRFDITPTGFHAQILSPNGAVYIDPLNRGDNIAHASYYKRDNRHNGEIPACIVLPNPDGRIAPQGDGDFLRTAETLRTYRLANAATGEYTAFHGGTVALGQAAIVTAINRVTGIYEVEVGVRMVLVGNNDSVVYTDGGTDPYSNDNGSAMLSQNISNLNSVIGSGNYDIGHVFSTGGGGVAFLGVICTSSKGGGVTGLPSPIGDNFYVDYVAHEMGHQFGANHTFNSVTSNCGGGNRNGGTAYEPGSGSTIMAYAGICGADNLQSHSDPYFLHESYREIRNYITASSGSSCSVNTATGNSDPTVDAGPDYTIPQSTPFILTAASASDPDSDPLTYCWEERDLGAAQALTDADNGSSPLWRSWDPVTEPYRLFPRLPNLLNNNFLKGEKLPTTNRDMDFRCTVRDNRAGGGGVAFDDMTVTVSAGAGPFLVTSPNTSTDVWSGGETVTWDVAGTTGAPINAATVNILLSTDGGQTYPIVLAANTPNDGSQAIVAPNLPTTTARVKVEAVGNIFFDISNANFTIEEQPALAILLPNGTPASVAPAVATTIDVQVIPLAENVVPGSPTMYYRADGGAYQSYPLTPLGGDLYQATLPPSFCADTPEYYFSAEGDGSTVITEPATAPSLVFASGVGSLTQVFADNCETDMGWTATFVAEAAGTTEGDWERGVPLGNDRGDPPTDADGSGQCYLTENDPGDINSDVDNGTAILTSPVFDMSAGGAISYSYWLNDIPGGPIGVEDSMVVEVATDAGGTNWQQVRSYATVLDEWRTDTIQIGTETVASSTIRIRFAVSDLDPGDVIEAGLDNITMSTLACADAGDGDFDVDGDVDLYDYGRLQGCWGEVGVSVPCMPGDLTGDDKIDADDWEIFNLVINGPNP